MWFFLWLLAFQPKTVSIQAPYVTTPPQVVDEMLRLAGVRKDDVLYDLGCGDGRIAIAAARKYGIRAVGININPDRISEARANARQSGVARLVEFREQDILEAPIREATVVTLYLLPSLNLELRPRLRKELRPGARVVSHCFQMGDWQPDKQSAMPGCPVYLWIIR